MFIAIDIEHGGIVDWGSDADVVGKMALECGLKEVIVLNVMRIVDPAEPKVLQFAVEADAVVDEGITDMECCLHSDSEADFYVDT